MNQSKFTRRRVGVALAVLTVATLLSWGQARAASWLGIEPFKSRRADVERALGRPLQAAPDASGALHFKVAGGTVTVQFVDAKFVASKKLSHEAEGTVLQIVLQHERAGDTPESLKLNGNGDFEREERGNILVFRNQKEGLYYTFIDGKLKTTRYAASAEQIGRAQLAAKK